MRIDLKDVAVFFLALAILSLSIKLDGILILEVLFALV